VECADKCPYSPKSVLNHILVSCEQAVDKEGPFCGKDIGDFVSVPFIHEVTVFFHRNREVIHRVIPLGITSSLT
jgi:hypothetical protein